MAPRATQSVQAQHATPTICTCSRLAPPTRSRLCMPHSSPWSCLSVVLAPAAAVGAKSRVQAAGGGSSWGNAWRRPPLRGGIAQETGCCASRVPRRHADSLCLTLSRILCRSPAHMQGMRGSPEHSAQQQQQQQQQQQGGTALCRSPSHMRGIRAPSSTIFECCCLYSCRL